MRTIFLATAFLISASIGFASNLQELDLSGAWKREVTTDRYLSSKSDIILIKTNLNPAGDSFYQVLGMDDVYGMRISKRADNGLWQLNWYSFYETGYDRYMKIQESPVLEITNNNNTLVLSLAKSGWENREFGRLIRITEFDGPVPSSLPRSEN